MRVEVEGALGGREVLTEALEDLDDPPDGMSEGMRATGFARLVICVPFKNQALASWLKNSCKPFRAAVENNSPVLSMGFSLLETDSLGILK